jgi:hypothetical protein
MENGSDVSYQDFVDCFGQASLGGVPSLGVPPILTNSHYAVAPHYSLLCNMTKNPSSWYCQQAVSGLKAFAQNPQSTAAGYHAYEPLWTYQGVIDAGVKSPLNADELTSFQEKIFKGVTMHAGHETRVENHGVDCAIQQLYMMKVFPNMTCSGCTYNVPQLMCIPKKIVENWLHAHALDEYATGYDAISIVRLIGVLEMMPDADLTSEKWKEFVLRFADSSKSYRMAYRYLMSTTFFLYAVFLRTHSHPKRLFQ